MPGMDPAVKKETGYIAVWVVLLSLVMEAVFLLVHKWDLSVLFGNVGGAVIAVGSFFLMACKEVWLPYYQVYLQH